jgi:hypothetical protein
MGRPDPEATPDKMAAAVRELQEQVSELRQAVMEIGSESARYRAETMELRKELEATRIQGAQTQGGATQEQKVEGDAAQVAANSLSPQPDGAGSLDQRVAKLEEESQLLEGKVDEQYQTKVASGSKYRVRLSGIALLNLFSNRGSFDSQDFPTLVNPPGPGSPNGSFGATLRQSEIGLEVFGPHVAGANTTGEVHVDFAGGFPNIPNGVNSGIMRLRTATLRFDWQHTSIIGGQDELFFSPLSPTSFASLAVPAFANAGNLWEWVPQVRVEHRFDFSDRSWLTLQAGILYNLVGDVPVLQWGNVPQAGERSGHPAYATRVSWTRNAFGHPMTLGAGGYYSRQDWWFGRHIDGWAGTADWNLPLSHGFSITGEFYRGYAVGALGGGIGRTATLTSAIFDPSADIQGVGSLGGWSQLKFKPAEKLEFNSAFGVDNPLAQDIRVYPQGLSNNGLDPTLRQNRSFLANVIYRPHTNLLFSAEYRHLKTYQLDLPGEAGEQVNLMMGILF